MEVNLEGEGKLGLVFVKESEPPEIKTIKEGGLAAKVWHHAQWHMHFASRAAAAADTRVACHRRPSQATPKLTEGMTLVKVGDTTVEDLDYGTLRPTPTPASRTAVSQTLPSSQSAKLQKKSTDQGCALAVIS